MVRAYVAMHIPQVMGGVNLTYLGNGWTDRAEIGCVARDQLAMLFTPLRSGVHLHPKRDAHVRTAFPYLGNGWTDYAEI